MMNIVCVVLVGVIVVLWNKCNKAIDLAEKALDQRDELRKQLADKYIMNVTNEFAVNKPEGYELVKAHYVRDNNGNWILEDAQFQR